MGDDNDVGRWGRWDRCGDGLESTADGVPFDGRLAYTGADDEAAASYWRRAGHRSNREEGSTKPTSAAHHGLMVALTA